MLLHRMLSMQYNKRMLLSTGFLEKLYGLSRNFSEKKRKKKKKNPPSPKSSIQFYVNWLSFLELELSVKLIKSCN